MSTPLLSIERLRHRFPNGRVLSLSIQLAVQAGQAAIITGPSGSGKSTLLRAIAGCLNEDGETEWQAEVLAQGTALVLQDPEAQLLCTTVEEEVAFGLRNLGMEEETVSRRVTDALGALGITSLHTRNCESLSTGQKQRVVLAALLAMRPSLLLLDEPFSQLDSAGEAQLRRWLSEYKSSGGAVIVAAHEVEAGDPLWDLHIDIQPTALSRVQPQVPSFSAPSAGLNGCPDTVLEAEGLIYRTDRDDAVLDELTLKLNRGCRTHVTGENGAGKSTLLRCLLGLQTPQAGRVTIAEIKVSHPGKLAGRVGYLPQNADLTLFEETVTDEVGFTVRRQLGRMSARAQVDETLTLCGLQHLAKISPLCLSHGERHVVALASTLAAKPAVLLLDEPLTGLDDQLARSVLAILDYWASQYGTAVLLVSHGALPVAWGDEHLVLQGGRLYEA